MCGRENGYLKVKKMDARAERARERESERDTKRGTVK